MTVRPAMSGDRIEQGMRCRSRWCASPLRRRRASCQLFLTPGCLGVVAYDAEHMACLPSSSMAPRMVLPSMASALSAETVAPRATPGQSGIELDRVDTDQRGCASPTGWAGGTGASRRRTRKRYAARPGAEVVDPFAGDRLVAIACRTASRRRRAPAPWARAWRRPWRRRGIVDVLEELGQGSHLFGAERRFRHSHVAGGGRDRRPQAGTARPGTGDEGTRVWAARARCSRPGRGEAAGRPTSGPARGTVDRAPEQLGVDERLRRASAGRPVPHQTARASESTRAEIALTAGA